MNEHIMVEHLTTNFAVILIFLPILFAGQTQNEMPDIRQ